MTRPDLESIAAQCDALPCAEWIAMARTELPAVTQYALELEAQVKRLQTSLGIALHGPIINT